jgi:MoxR-like ATPase
MYPGLTMVVGPPGTGKTDVAVQIISNWFVTTVTVKLYELIIILFLAGTTTTPSKGLY